MRVELPWEDFLHSRGEKTSSSGAYFDIENGKGERIMSVLVGRDLLDNPRAIDIALERPDTFVRPARIFGGFGFRYHALISRRMQYSDVPRWDRKKKLFLKPSPPVLRIYKTADNELLQESEMRSMCHGHGWALFVDFPPELADGSELRVVVVHDTGDLFGELKTECSFRYRKVMHGGVRRQ
jgi:hypothetical protein